MARSACDAAPHRMASKNESSKLGESKRVGSGKSTLSGMSVPTSVSQITCKLSPSASSSTEVRLTMSRDDAHAVITVEDNGLGLPPGIAARSGAHGLKQMKFRMQVVGGSCEVGNSPTCGTVVTLLLGTLPVALAAAGAMAVVWSGA